MGDIVKLLTKLLGLQVANAVVAVVVIIIVKILRDAGLRVG